MKPQDKKVNTDLKIESYYKVRFRWFEEVDLKKALEDFNQSFSVKILSQPHDRYEIAMFIDFREELKVSADTLSIFLSRFRAVLYQKEAAPFTERDMELREKVLKLYPRNRSTPLF